MPGMMRCAPKFLCKSIEKLIRPSIGLCSIGVIWCSDYLSRILSMQDADAFNDETFGDGGWDADPVRDHTQMLYAYDSD